MDGRAIKYLDKLAERLVDLERRNELPKQTTKSCKKWLLNAVATLSPGKLKLELFKYKPLYAKRFFRAVKKARQIHVLVKPDGTTERHPLTMPTSSASFTTSPKNLACTKENCTTTTSMIRLGKEASFAAHMCKSSLSCKPPTTTETSPRILPVMFATPKSSRPATLPSKSSPTTTSSSQTAPIKVRATATAISSTKTRVKGPPTIARSCETATSKVPSTSRSCHKTKSSKLPPTEKVHATLPGNSASPATFAVDTGNSSVSAMKASCQRTPLSNPPAMAEVSPTAVTNKSAASIKFPTTKATHHRISASKSATTKASRAHSETSNSDAFSKSPETKLKVIDPRMSPRSNFSATIATAPRNSTEHCYLASSPYNLFTECGVHDALETSIGGALDVNGTQVDGVTATQVLNLLAILGRTKRDTEYEQVNAQWRAKKFVDVSRNLASISEVLGRESTFQFQSVAPRSLERLMNQTLLTMSEEVNNIRLCRSQQCKRASILLKGLHNLLAYFHFKHGILQGNMTHEKENDFYSNIMAALLSVCFELCALLARTADSDAAILGKQSLSKACVLLQGDGELLMSVLLHMSHAPTPDDAAFLLPTLEHVICHPSSHWTASSYIKYILVCRMARQLLQFSHQAELSILNQMSLKAVPPSDLGSWVMEHWPDVAPEILFDNWPSHLTTFLLQVASHDLCHRLQMCISSFECPALVRTLPDQQDDSSCEEYTTSPASSEVKTKKDKNKKQSSPQEPEVMLITQGGINKVNAPEKEKRMHTLKETEKAFMKSDGLKEDKKKKRKKRCSPQVSELTLITPDEASEQGNEMKMSKLKESGKVSEKSDVQKHSSSRKGDTVSGKSEVKKKKKKKKNSKETEMILITSDEKGECTLKESEKVYKALNKQDNSDVKKKKKKKKKKKHLPQKPELIVNTLDEAKTVEKMPSELKESENGSVPSNKQKDKSSRTDVKVSATIDTKKKKTKNQSYEESEIMLITPDDANVLEKETGLRACKESHAVSVTSGEQKNTSLIIDVKKKKKKKNRSAQESEIILTTPHEANELGKDKQLSELKESANLYMTSAEPEDYICKKHTSFSTKSEAKKKKKKKDQMPQESEMRLSTPEEANQIEREILASTIKQSEKLSMTSDPQQDSSCSRDADVSAASDVEKKKKNSSCQESEIILIISDEDTDHDEKKRMSAFGETGKVYATSDKELNSSWETSSIAPAVTDAFEKKKLNVSRQQSELVTPEEAHELEREKNVSTFKESENLAMISVPEQDFSWSKDANGSATSDVQKKKERNHSLKESEIILITSDEENDHEKDKQTSAFEKTGNISVTADQEENSSFEGRKAKKRKVCEEQMKANELSDYEMNEERQSAVRKSIDKVVSDMYITGDVSRAILESKVNSSAKAELVQGLDPGVWKIRQNQLRTSAEKDCTVTVNETNVVSADQRGEEHSVQLGHNGAGEDKGHLEPEQATCIDGPLEAIAHVDRAKKTGHMKSITKSSMEITDSADGNQGMWLRERTTQSKSTCRMKDSLRKSTANLVKSRRDSEIDKNVSATTTLRESSKGMKIPPGHDTPRSKTTNRTNGSSRKSTANLVKSRPESRSDHTVSPTTTLRESSKRMKISPRHALTSTGGAVKLRSLEIVSDSEEDQAEMRAGPWRVSHLRNLSHLQTLSELGRIASRTSDSIADLPVTKELKERSSVDLSRKASRKSDSSTCSPVTRRELKDESSLSEESMPSVSPTTRRMSTRVTRSKMVEILQSDSSPSKQPMTLRTHFSRIHHGRCPMCDGPDKTIKDSPLTRKRSSSGDSSPQNKRSSSGQFKSPEFVVKRLLCTGTENSGKLSENNEGDIQKFTKISACSPPAEKRPCRHTRSSDKVNGCKSSEIERNLENLSGMSSSSAAWAFQSCFPSNVPRFLPGESSDDAAGSPKVNGRKPERMTTRSSRSKPDRKPSKQMASRTSRTKLDQKQPEQMTSRTSRTKRNTKQPELTRMKQTEPSVRTSFRRSQRLRAQSALSSETLSSDSSETAVQFTQVRNRLSSSSR